MKTAFIIFGVLIFVFSLLFLFIPEIKPIYLFKNHKRIVSKKLYSLAKNYDNLLINDFCIKNNEQTIAFDQIYFGNKYIYCIKNVSYKFGIEGNAKDLKWFNYTQKKSYDYINNPLITNSESVSKLKKYLNIQENEHFFFSIICLNDNCDSSIKNLSLYENVLKQKDLKKFILSKEKDKSVGTINQSLLENTVKVLYQQCQQDSQTR